LLERYAAIWRGDRSALLALLAQCLLVAILLGALFGNLSLAPEKQELIRLKTPVPTRMREQLNDVLGKREHVQWELSLFNLMVVSCFWFGYNTAAKELVKERALFQRERDYNLRLTSYFLSKLLVLTLVALLQATFLFAIIRSWCHPPGSLAGQWATLGALATAGTAVGLLISAFARTEEVATALVPIAVIPQIILAGVIAPLSGALELLAKGIITVYWGQRAFESLLPTDDLDLLKMETGRWSSSVAIIVIHALVAAVAAIMFLRLAEVRQRRL
jgi:ABC-type multidrug transport system permease subunit